jgi:hypothetical protein
VPAVPLASAGSAGDRRAGGKVVHREDHDKGLLATDLKSRLAPSALAEAGGLRRRLVGPLLFAPVSPLECVCRPWPAWFRTVVILRMRLCSALSIARAGSPGKQEQTDDQ